MNLDALERRLNKAGLWWDVGAHAKASANVEFLNLLERLRKAEAEAESLDEAIRLALDVTVGWDQINPAKTAEGKIERMAAILNKALEKNK